MLAQVEKKVDCFVLFCFLDLHKKRLLSVFSSLWNSTELSFYCVCCGAYVALHFSLKGVGFKSGNVLGQVTGLAVFFFRNSCLIVTVIVILSVSVMMYPHVFMRLGCHDYVSSHNWVVLLYIINLVKFLNVTPDKCQHDYD